MPPNEATESQQPVASFSRVSKSYGAVHALGPLDANVAPGITALLGPNGSGKTTFLRLLVGLLAPDEGTVTVLGHKAGTPEARKHIGYAPQGDAEFPALTGIESVAYAGRLSGMSRGDAVQRAHQVMDYVGLRDERYRPAAQYSTGMRQRLKLAQALAHAPALLVLDEPTEGVDPEARREILGLVRELAHEHGVHALVSTHVLGDVQDLRANAIVLADGQLASSASLDALRAPDQRAYRLGTDGDQGVLASRLEALGARITHGARGLEVSGLAPAVLLSAVTDAGQTIRFLAPAALSMEEAFARAVGGERHS